MVHERGLRGRGTVTTAWPLRPFHATLTDSQLVASANPPEDYPTNLVSLQGVWEAFRRATPPLIGIWQVMDRRPGRSGGGDGATKVDVVARGGDEWIKVNTSVSMVLIRVG